MSAQSIRDTYSRNVSALRRCQLAYDRMEPSEYYEGPDDDEYEEAIETEEDE